MGWTHSWSRPTELPADAFRCASRDCRALLVEVGVPLAGFNGTGEPKFNDDAIVFNGVVPVACEPFAIHQTEFDRRGRPVMWSFCKTEQLPYDLCVQLALIVMKHHLGDTIIVNSDGTDGDWAAARLKCQHHLGYGEDFRLAEKERA